MQSLPCKNTPRLKGAAYFFVGGAPIVGSCQGSRMVACFSCYFLHSAADKRKAPGQAPYLSE
jgi:hypothetical protein